MLSNLSSGAISIKWKTRKFSLFTTFANKRFATLYRISRWMLNIVLLNYSFSRAMDCKSLIWSIWVVSVISLPCFTA